jgi:tRNA(Leu) C34 or U34 (ribose-2'-O)-methylase TrmL
MSDITILDVLGTPDSSTSGIVGKKAKPVGVTPAIVLTNPKFAHNVGAAQRAASCFGIKQLWFTGNRVSLEPSNGQRLPREERMKGYKDVDVIQYDYFYDQFPSSVTPVAVELRPNSEELTYFEHPENPLYVFGPEDGSIPQVSLRHCHRFVVIPTRHCVNLAAAVYIVLYDRQLKQYQKRGQ